MGSPDPADDQAADRCAFGPVRVSPARGKAASKGRPPDPGLPDRVSSIDLCDRYDRLRHVRSQVLPLTGKAMPPAQLTYTSEPPGAEKTYRRVAPRPSGRLVPGSTQGANLAHIRQC